MPFPSTPHPSPLDTIPDPERIRGRLTVLHIEARLLRRLLRVAVDVRQEHARVAQAERCVREVAINE
jgi:hypothetical protein